MSHLLRNLRYSSNDIVQKTILPRINTILASEEFSFVPIKVEIAISVRASQNGGVAFKSLIFASGQKGCKMSIKSEFEPQIEQVRTIRNRARTLKEEKVTLGRQIRALSSYVIFQVNSGSWIWTEITDRCQ